MTDMDTKRVTSNAQLPRWSVSFAEFIVLGVNQQTAAVISFHFHITGGSFSALLSHCSSLAPAIPVWLNQSRQVDDVGG